MNKCNNSREIEMQNKNLKLFMSFLSIDLVAEANVLKYIKKNK